MELFENDETKPSRIVPLPRSKSTRTGPLKLVPVIVRVVPPAGGPVFGTMFVIVGAVDGGGGVTGCVEKVTWICFDVLLTVAVMVAVPAVGDVSVAVATPFVVVRMVLVAPVSAN